MKHRAAKLVGSIVLVGVIAAIASSQLSGAPRDAVAVSGHVTTFAVKRGTLPVTLKETGTLKTKKATIIRSTVEGQAKIATIVAEGAAVKSGDVVVELDQTDVKQKIEELEGQRIQQEAELKAAKTDFAVQEAQAKTDVEKAELRVEVSKVNHRKLIEGDIPKEQKTRQLRIEKAKSALQRVEEKYKTMPELQQLGFVTKSQVEEERLKVEEAKVELDAAKQDFELYDKYQKPLDTKQKEAEVGEAEREHTRTMARSESQVESKRAVMLQRELQMKKTLDRLSREKVKLENMTLHAPTDGIVVYGDPDRPWNSGEIKAGAQVWQNMPICTIPDTTEFGVILQVHEADINQISSGLPVTVTLDTYKGVVLKGEVSKIAAVAISGGWQDDVKKFAVDIAIVGSTLTLRTGITAKAEIAIGEMKNVIYVPLQTVQVKDGKHRCFVRARGSVTARDVEIGRANDDFVEIKKGLDEGEVVLLYDPSGEGAPEAK